jgi:hypothetical protein
MYSKLERPTVLDDLFGEENTVARLLTLSKACVWAYAGFTISRHIFLAKFGEFVR